MMTRKHYIAIAGSFAAAAQAARDARADLGAFIALDDAASRIARALKADNPRFDTDKFMRACNVIVVRGRERVS